MSSRPMPQGQSDRVNVTGTATINGGTVQVMAAPGNYGTSTTYTILNATGGVIGHLLGRHQQLRLPDAVAELQRQQRVPDARPAGQRLLGLRRQHGQPAQRRHGARPVFASATGDFATVIGALAGLSTAQAAPALNAISGQPYADFGSFNVANNALFMNALGQQMALARGGRGGGQRQALAEACDVAACDGTSPFSVWGSALGGLGSVQGDGNASTFTYNVGGTAAGIDYRVTRASCWAWAPATPTARSGSTASRARAGRTRSASRPMPASRSGASMPTRWRATPTPTTSCSGRSPSPACSRARPTAATGANQFLGQVETGYEIAVYAPAPATLTPFARFQASSINQAAFNEWGANSLSLNVSQQTTTSLRTTLGADLAASIGLGDTRTLDIGLRLGWLHEYANTARPITAAFAGAPSANFTVYGATPQRDAAVIGFQASTSVADNAQLYLRYDGEIASGTDNHTLNLGVRLRW